MKYDYDAIVIGSGSAGLTSSIGLTKVGKQVLLIEKGYVGGECTNSGCVPSKSFIHLAREYFEAKKISGETKKLTEFKNKILSKVREKILEIREEDEEALKAVGIKTVKGSGKFKNKNTIEVEGEKYSAKNIIIATGSSPVLIPIKGLNDTSSSKQLKQSVHNKNKQHALACCDESILTNENIFELKEIPQDLLIYGGGPIACEMAQAFAHLGTNISIVIRGKHILSRDEAEVIQETEKNFQELGIKIFNHATIASCKNKIAQIKSLNSEKIDEIRYDYLLMGLGRTPNLAGLNLEAAKVEYTKKGITVDKHYRTSQKNIFAIGDVSSKAKFTHVADDQGRHIVKKILLPWSRTERKQIPRVTYLDEEVAAVGLTWQECLDKYNEDKIVKLSIPWKSADRAKTDEEKYGLAMVFAKRISGKILGASFTGNQAGEIINFFTLAIENKTSLWKVNKIIFPYPVRGLLIKKLSDQFIAFTVANLKGDLWNLAKSSIYKIIAIITAIVLLAYYVF